MGWKDFLIRMQRRKYFYGDYYPDECEYDQMEIPRKPIQKEPTTKQVENREDKKPNFNDDTTQIVETKKLPVDKEEKDIKDKALNERETFKIFIPVKKEKKNVIVFIVENSVSTRNFYKAEILRLVNKIVDSNKQCFFMMHKVGDNKKLSGIMDYESLTKNDVINTLFLNDKAEAVDYVEVLKYIESFYESAIFDFDYQDKKYEIQNINIVFVGSGEVPLNKEVRKESIELIKKIAHRGKVKTFKYFCMEDNQTISAAKLGFPVIGHIVTDFYR